MERKAGKKEYGNKKERQSIETKINGRPKPNYIVTLPVNGLNNPHKRQKCQTRPKKGKIQLYAAYRRHTLDSNIKQS